MKNDSIKANVEHLIKQCIEENKKNVLVLFDKSTEDIVNFFIDSLETHGKRADTFLIKDAERHGINPPANVEEKMLAHDIVMCLTKYSLAHTKARLKAEKAGVPFLSMPGYDINMLENRAFLVDYHRIYPSVKKFTEKLTQHNNIYIETKLGTKLWIDTSGRSGNCCPGYVNSCLMLGSPPDIESNIAPVERNTNGVIVVDGSITDPRIGMLHTPVTLKISDGNVTDIFCNDRVIETTLKEIFSEVNDDKAYVIGELGVGFNELAELCGNMLIYEGTKGCIHFGIGSNWTIGGENNVPFHLDFVLKNATVIADGAELIKEGAIIDGHA